MNRTFFYGSGSPFAWRVWLALEYKQLDYDFKLLSFSAGDHRTAEFARLNPRCKVPVLIDDDFVLYESAAIVEYLEDAYTQCGAGRLFPEDIRQRALARRIILEADNYLVPGVLPMQREVFFKSEATRDQAVIQQGREFLRGELQGLESLVRGDYLLGALTAADLTLYPLLTVASRLETRFGLFDFSAMLGPKLQGWMERMQALPQVAKTWPPHWKTSD